MDKPLSFSGYKKYHDCPRLYKYHYIDKEPAGKETSALIVGSIIDDIGMRLLKDPESTYDVDKEVKAVYKRNIEFYEDDLDLDLINLETIQEYAKSKGWEGDNIGDALKSFIKDQANLSMNQYEVLKKACWQSLAFKIEAMIESFKKWILPQIAEVHEIQLHLEDEVTHGYLDFTATLKDGRKVLFDLKTSKRSYETDAVLKSPQLSLYAAMHNYEYAGFIVLCKTLNKNKYKTCAPCGHAETGGNRTKCPKCKEKMQVQISPTSYSQMLVDSVPDWNKHLTKEAMRETIEAIDKGVFPRNLNTCYWMYGRECPYVSKCWKNNNTKETNNE